MSENQKIRRILYPEEQPPDAVHKLRVAAYCRVSTMSDNQEGSFEIQRAVYTEKILSEPDWEMAGIYADRGISGTQASRRPRFLQMIADCEAGKIDMDKDEAREQDDRTVSVHWKCGLVSKMPSGVVRDSHDPYHKSVLWDGYLLRYPDRYPELTEEVRRKADASQ